MTITNLRPQPRKLIMSMRLSNDNAERKEEAPLSVTCYWYCYYNTGLNLS
jgi:hypothetical protein